MSLRFDEDLGKSEPTENEKVKPKKKRQWRNQEDPNQLKGSDLKKSKQELLAKTREEVHTGGAILPFVILLTRAVFNLFVIFCIGECRF